jgi:hypothetical protein
MEERDFDIEGKAAWEAPSGVSATRGSNLKIVFLRSCGETWPLLRIPCSLRDLCDQILRES